MDNGIQLISDGDGLAVIGEPTAVQKFLSSVGFWAGSRELDLRRLKPLLSSGSDITQTASEIAANSGRWIKLTEESARRIQKSRLIPTDTPGISHLMVGVPGKIQNWLQAEQGPGTLLTNPAVLSGVAGIMSQVAAQQSMAEITDYLARIDEKVDDVLRKVDNTVIAQMVGVGAAIERAMTIREEVDEVDETLWSTVDQAHTTIGATKSYALEELDAIAKKLESTKVRELAKRASEVEPEVQKWLAVLARCFQLHEAVDVLELDRRMTQSLEKLDAYRRGMVNDRQKRRELISEHTEDLLGRMDAAVGTANARMVWTRTKSLDVVASANRVATGVHDFYRPLRIESDPPAWAPRQLGRAADMGSQTIQKTKDASPYVGAGVALVGAAVVAKRGQDEDQT
ncbi:MAG TPA: hypothetical protein VIJ15_05750 [Dermatophilaceae bacterium]